MFFYFLVVTLIPIMFFYNTTLVSIEDYFKGDREKKLLTTANIIAGNYYRINDFYNLEYDGDNDAARQSALDFELDLRSKETGARILIFDTKGIVVKDTNRSEIGNTLLLPEVLNALQRKNDVVFRKNENALYAASWIENERAEKMGVVLLVQSIGEIYDELSEIQKRIILFILLTTIIISLLVFFLSQWIIEPLNNFLKVVTKMSDGHLNQRINVKGHDEYAQLGQSFNDIASKLEEAERSREEFVSNVSHELKTPLSSIKVLSESILLEENVPITMYREFMEDINAEVDRMTSIINDLLVIVRLSHRENVLNIKQIEANKMIVDILKRLYPLAKQKNIDLIYEDVRKVVIDADEMKLSLALTNLIENGIKYTHHEGTVKVIVDSDYQNAYISVIDTGIGINDDEQSKIFDRFYRIDKTRDRETGGTGLGLPISRQIVLLHNGVIRLSSKENEGSTFVVQIPINYIKG